MKKSRKRPILIAIVCFVLLFGVVLTTEYLNRVKEYRNKVENLTINEINISAVSDGVYIGECDIDMIYVKVEVKINDGTIAAIKLLQHDNGRGESAEAITQKIVEQQKIKVDVVSGATNSSKAIEKAVENALSK